MTRRTHDILYKLILLGIALMFIIFPITGRASIGTRIIINSIGIDVNDGYTVTVEAVGQESESLMSQGDSVTIALKELDIKDGKYAEMSRCGLIVFGRDTTTTRVVDTMLALLNEGRIDPGCMVVCANGSAEDFMNESVKISGLSGGVAELMRFVDEHQHYSIERLLPFLGMIKSKSQTACLPLVDIVERQGETGEKTQTDASGGGGSGESGGSKTELALLKKSMVYGSREVEMGESETRGLSFLCSKKSTGTLNIDDFVFNGKSYGNVSAAIEDKSAKVRMKDATHAAIEVSVKFRCDDRHIILKALRENNAEATEITDALSKQFSDMVSRDMENLVEFCRAESVDALGLCRESHKYFPPMDKPVEAMLRLMKVEIVPDVKAY